MRVMVLLKATDDSEKGFRPTPEMKEAMEAMGRFNDELRKAGILRMADGLKPSSQGKRVAFDRPGRTVIDGPFAQPRELVAGFWFWDVKDMDEAVSWVRRSDLYRSAWRSLHVLANPSHQARVRRTDYGLGPTDR